MDGSLLPPDFEREPEFCDPSIDFEAELLEHADGFDETGNEGSGDHWQQYFAVDGSKKQQKKFRKIRRQLDIDEEFSRRAEQTSASLDRHQNKMVLALDEPGRDHTKLVSEWYDRLGSTTELEGCGTHLTLAALLVERSINKADMRSETVTAADRLLAADLYFELFLLSGRENYYSPESVDFYANNAARHLDRVKQLEQENSHSALAAKHREVDIAFELLWQRWPRTLKHHNTPSLEEQSSRAEYRTALEIAARDIIEATEAWRARFDTERQHKHQSVGAVAVKASNAMYGSLTNFEGDLSEWFASLAYRFELYRTHAEGAATIRSSTRREHKVIFDNSKTTTKKDRESHQNMSVDTVVEEYQDGEFYRYYYQLKSGSGPTNYLPPIRTFDGIRDLVMQTCPPSRAEVRSNNGSNSMHYINTMERVTRLIAQELEAGCPDFDQEAQRLVEAMQARLVVAG